MYSQFMMHGQKNIKLHRKINAWNHPSQLDIPAWVAAQQWSGIYCTAFSSLSHSLLVLTLIRKRRQAPPPPQYAPPVVPFIPLRLPSFSFTTAILHIDNSKTNRLSHDLANSFRDDNYTENVLLSRT